LIYSFVLPSWQKAQWILNDSPKAFGPKDISS
jgi:hypothetical protein